MLDGSETLIHGGKLGFLQLDERLHVLARIAMSQVEHRVVEAVETGQRDELKLVAHRTKLFLEFGDRRVVEILLPVKRWRAVVRQ